MSFLLVILINVISRGSSVSWPWECQVLTTRPPRREQPSTSRNCSVEIPTLKEFPGFYCILNIWIIINMPCLPVIDETFFKCTVLKKGLSNFLTILMSCVFRLSGTSAGKCEVENRSPSRRRLLHCCTRFDACTRDRSRETGGWRWTDSFLHGSRFVLLIHTHSLFLVLCYSCTATDLCGNHKP